jgi:hypothetical protein
VAQQPLRVEPTKAHRALLRGVPALLIAIVVGGAIWVASLGEYGLAACMAGGCILPGMWAVALAQACGSYIECDEHALRFVYRRRPFFGRALMTVKEVPYDEIEDIEVVRLGPRDRPRLVMAVGLVRRGRRIAVLTCLEWSGLASFVNELEKRRPARVRG